MSIERILVVDDNNEVSHLVARVADGLGYGVLGVDDPREAIKAFYAEPDGFRCVITDWRMPYLNGSELAERLKRVAPHLPVILISGGPTEYLDTSMFDVVLEKPCTSDQLARAIRQVGANSGEFVIPADPVSAAR